MSDADRVREAFLAAAQESLGTMAMLEVREDQTAQVDRVRLEKEIAATIGLSGQNEGLVLLAVPPDLARIAVAAMLGQEPGELAEADLADGVGEIANMVAGVARRSLSDSALAFTLGLPTIVIGEQTVIGPPHAAGGSGTMVHADVSGHRMRIAIWLQRCG